MWDKRNSQKDSIGMLIFKLRTQKKISEEALSRGLCSVSELRKIESGEKTVRKMLFDALLGRMGCAADNFSVILEREEYELYDLQNQIQKAYLMEKTEELQQMIEKFKSRISGRKGCEYQFYCKMKFLIGGYTYDTVERMEKVLISIIRITVPCFTIERVLEGCICREEIFLCCLLASIYLEYEKKEKAKILLENLRIYVENHDWDIEEKVKVYPQIVILLFQVYDVWNENEKWLAAAQKARNLLAETSRTIWMDKLLEGYQIGMEEKIRKRQRKFTELEKTDYHNIRKELESIQKLKQEYGIVYGNREMLLPSYEYDEIYLLQEVILDYRIRTKKSQSELGEMLGVEWETISRYENGRNKPNRKNYQLLSKEIGLPYDRYDIHLPVGDYEIYQKIRQVERYLFRNEFILAEQLFLEIEPLIPKERAENKQYCIRTKAFLDFSLNRINQKERRKQLEAAIRCTFPNYCIKETNFLKHHIPKRYEAILLNQIAACYEELGEREMAIRILKAVLDVYKESKVKEDYHIFVISLVKINYSEYLGRQGNYKAALEEIEKALKIELQFKRGSMIPYLLYAKGWNLLKMEGESITEERRMICMNYYQQAYWFSNFMNDFITQQKIEELYQKDFGKEIPKGKE